MKRIIAVALFGAMVAGSAFAEITFGAWGRARWSPLVVGGDVETKDGKAEEVTNMGVGSGPNWGQPGASIRFDVNGKNESETVGFGLQVRGESDGVFRLPDPRSFLWAKPFGDVLKVTMGLYDDDTLRGKFGGINDATIVVGGNNLGAEDALFQRLRSNNKLGSLIALYPVDGLSVFANIGVSGTDGATPMKDAIGDTFASGQYAIGYNISGIGLARFQFLGGTYGKTGNYSPLGGDAKAWNRIQLAFNLTAVDKLSLDLGATIPLAVEPIVGTYTQTTAGTPEKVNLQDKDGNETTIEVASGYTPPATSVSTEVLLPFFVSLNGQKYLLGKGDKYSPAIGIALAASYNLSPIVIQTRIDVALGETLEIKDASDKMEFGTQFSLVVSPTYKLDGIGTVGARISFKTVGNTKMGSQDYKDGKTDLGIGAWFDRDIFGGLNFAIGFAANIPVSGDGYDGKLNATSEDAAEQAAKATAKAQAFKVSVPLVITYSL